MSELKFRVWSKKENEFFTDVAISERGEILLHVESSTWIVVDKENFEIVQYTGLTDKNGKEIYYDSSIFNFLFVSSSREIVPLVGVMSFNIDHQRCEINVSNHPDICILWFDCLRMSNFEIIGNLCENPELLEDAK